jgi:hypothetical protein
MNQGITEKSSCQIDNGRDKIDQMSSDAMERNARQYKTIQRNEMK